MSNFLSKRFWKELSIWSQEAFGSDNVRGPLGPLKHLRKEIDEAIEIAKQLKLCESMEDDSVYAELYEYLIIELADCQHLVFDAARRLDLSHKEFFLACLRKLEENKSRIWNKPSTDEPVEHVREELDKDLTQPVDVEKILNSYDIDNLLLNSLIKATDAVKDIIFSSAAAKGYGGNVGEKQELLDFVKNRFGSHAEGEILYKLLRWQAKRDPVDLIKIMSWAFLIWHQSQSK